MEDRMSWIEAGRKRPRLEEKAATSPVKFRGVLPQQNGNWGAQIYANHQRIWLGTFRTEKDAAMAYDSAAIKLRRDDHHSQRNFPWTQQNVDEPIFQSGFTEEEILDMIRDGTYQCKFIDFLKNQSENSGIVATPQNRLLQLQCDRQILCRHLFQKELTPSDVGKLNRLVIPKKYAVRYFPSIKENEIGTPEGSGSYTDDTQLVFHDRVMKTWKFRYCYWRSSQSFVFTRGWNRFVKEKDLRAKDVVTFYACEYTKRPNGEETFCLIDVNYNNGEGSIGNENDDPIDERNHNVELRLNLGKSYSFRSDEDGDEEEFKEEQNGVMLFGVQIN